MIFLHINLQSVFGLHHLGYEIKPGISILSLAKLGFSENFLMFIFLPTDTHTKKKGNYSPFSLVSDQPEVTVNLERRQYHPKLKQQHLSISCNVRHGSNSQVHQNTGLNLKINPNCANLLDAALVTGEVNAQRSILSMRN